MGGWVRVCRLLRADRQGVAFMLWPDLPLSQVFPLAGFGPRAAASDLESPRDVVPAAPPPLCGVIQTPGYCH